MLPTLTLGDPFPRIRLPDQDGVEVPLHHQSIAGDPVVIAVCRSARDPAAGEALALLEREREGIAGRGAHLFALTGDAPGANLAARKALSTGIRLLSDAEGKALALCGAPPSGCRALVLRRDMRVAAVLDGPAAAVVAGALAALDGMAAPTVPPVVSSGHAPVLILDPVLPPEFCDRLMDLWAKGERETDQVTNQSGNYGGTGAKKRSDHVIKDPGLSKEIQGVFIKRLLPDIARALQFQVTESEYLRIGCYDAESGGFFRRHRDNVLAANAHRRFAVSLNLNDDYEGGEVTFPEYGHARYRPGRGAAVVFSCSLLHEAMPVSKGRRFVLLTFLSGKTLGG